MALTVTPKESVKELLSQMYYAYYSTKANQEFSAFAGASSTVIELPVLSDGITLNTAEPDETKVKVIDGTVWDVTVAAGDDDMSFQIPSIHASIAEIFAEKKTAATVASTAFGADGSFAGQGYSTSPKRVEGSIFCLDATKTVGVYFPYVTGFANLTLGEEGKPAYFTYKFSAMGDAKGASYYIMKKQA